MAVNRTTRQPFYRTEVTGESDNNDRGENIRYGDGTVERKHTRIGNLGIALINTDRLAASPHNARLRVLAYKLLTMKAL